MKLIDPHRACIYSSDHAEIREFRIMPTIVIALRADREGGRLKFWLLIIEWLEWYVSIQNPWYKRQEPAKHTHREKAAPDPEWLKEGEE